MSEGEGDIHCLCLPGILLEVERVCDAEKKPAFCRIQLAFAGCPEILRQRCDQIDWRIVLSMSASL